MEATGNHTRARPSGSRQSELRVALLALCGSALLLPTAAPAVTCLSGSTSTEPVPSVSFLRGYWASLRGPSGLAVDRGGTVYATDPLAGSITARTPDGRRKRYSEKFGSPISIGISPADEEPIFVGDGASGKVTAFSQQFEARFELGSGVGEFQIPADIAVDPATGYVWVADSGANTVAVFEPGGTRVTTLTGGPGTPFLSPSGIAVDALAGEVIVADQLNSRLQVFDLAGNWRRCLGRQGSSPGRFGSPRGLAVDALGRIFISDVFQGRVQVIDRNGLHIAFLGEFGDRPGTFAGPADLVVDPFGRLFVATANGGRLDLFGLDAFEDPEVYLPAEVEVELGVPRRWLTRSVKVEIRLPGHRITPQQPTYVTVNGVTAGRREIADEDGDGDAELILWFSWQALQKTFPDGREWRVEVEGQYEGLKLLGEASLPALPGENTQDGGFAGAGQEQKR